MENQLIGTPKATFYLNELAGELAELFIEMKYEMSFTLWIEKNKWNF